MSHSRPLGVSSVGRSQGLLVAPTPTQTSLIFPIRPFWMYSQAWRKGPSARCWLPAWKTRLVERASGGLLADPDEAKAEALAGGRGLGIAQGAGRNNRRRSDGQRRPSHKVTAGHGFPIRHSGSCFKTRDWKTDV